MATSVLDLGNVAGRDGKDGKDGRDGIDGARGARIWPVRDDIDLLPAEAAVNDMIVNTSGRVLNIGGAFQVNPSEFQPGQVGTVTQLSPLMFEDGGTLSGAAPLRRYILRIRRYFTSSQINSFEFLLEFVTSKVYDNIGNYSMAQLRDTIFSDMLAVDERKMWPVFPAYLNMFGDNNGNTYMLPIMAQLSSDETLGRPFTIFLYALYYSYGSGLYPDYSPVEIDITDNVTWIDAIDTGTL